MAAMAPRQIVLSALRIRRTLPIVPTTAQALTLWARTGSSTAPRRAAEAPTTVEGGPSAAEGVASVAESAPSPSTAPTPDRREERKEAFDDFYKALMELPTPPPASEATTGQRRVSSLIPLSLF